MQHNFLHHVYFWLNNPGSTADRDELIAGLQKLAATPCIKEWHIGVPADTNREVIDRSYAVSWLLTFETAAAQDEYQDHPMHHAFIDSCKHLWSKVVVYDSVAL